MKILVLFTSYRQLDELKLQARFLVRCRWLCKNADLLWACNNVSIPRMELESRLAALPFTNKQLIHEDWNTGGYARGQFEVLAHLQERLATYDFVLQLHPDIYIAHEKKLVELFAQEYNQANSFLVSRIFGGDDPSFATDAFIFRPKLLPSGFFRDYLAYDTSINTKLERVFYSMIHKRNIAYAEIRRFVNGKYHRDIDELGLWHEHYSMTRAKFYLAHPALRFLCTFYFCIFRNPRLAVGVLRDSLIRWWKKQPQDKLLKQLSVA